MLRIIIADDHPVVRKSLKQILLEEFSPVHVDDAENATELLDKTLSHSWDIVITDLVMPGGGIFETLKVIKKEKPLLPVLVVSTYPAEQYSPRVLKAGAEEFISKDSLPNGLVTAIRRLIDQGVQPY
jgi:two-component system, NarL family, invasion response regulator UvrY